MKTHVSAAWPVGLSMGVCLLSTVAVGAEERLRPGLVWAQFHSPNLTRFAESGTDGQINLDTGTTINDYSRLWLGVLVPDVSGQIVLSAEADDGIKVWTSKTLVIDGWSVDRSREGKVTVVAGKPLPLEVHYYQAGGTGHVRLYWRRAGGLRELIPASAFRHTAADAERVQRMATNKEHVYPRLENEGAIYDPKAGARRPAEPIRLGPGPHLFIDEYLIESARGIEREVNRPKRSLPGPVVTGRKGEGDDCFQPYTEVVRDPNTGRFRIWYGVPENAGQSHVAHMESKDGIHWIRPHRVLGDASHIQFGVSVIDEGPGYADPAKRYKLGYYGDGGLRIAISSDGFEWKLLVPHVLVCHRHDINNIFRDTLRNRYMAIVSTYIPGERWSGLRRCTMVTTSDDLLRWRQPWLIVTPDDRVEDGETQFYAMCGFLIRGDLLIGMVKVLHDDYAADKGGKAAGIGYTALAWSRDGEHWTRDRETFFDRHPKKGEWDHAMAWIDCQVPVDDEVYLYYGGYARGHKINRFEERQIGLVRMARDRYVARRAGDKAGTLRTPPVIVDGDGITLNVDATGGEVRAQVIGADGKPVDGLAFADCRPIKGDALDAPVQWRGRLGAVRGKPVRLEFELRGASLFALGVGK